MPRGQLAPFGVVHVTPTRVRLYQVHRTIREVARGGFPLPLVPERRAAATPAASSGRNGGDRRAVAAVDGARDGAGQPRAAPGADLVECVDDALAHPAVCEMLPVHSLFVVAGERSAVLALADRSRHNERIAGVLAGDHSETAPATLAVLAERRLIERLGTRQRQALEAIAAASRRGEGRVLEGVQAVAGALDDGRRGTLVLVGDGSDDGRAELVTAALTRGASVVGLPAGYLRVTDGVALVARGTGDQPPTTR